MSSYIQNIAAYLKSNGIISSRQKFIYEYVSLQHDLSLKEYLFKILKAKNPKTLTERVYKQFIENDDQNIKKMIKKCFVIYDRFSRKAKLKFFYRWKSNSEAMKCLSQTKKEIIFQKKTLNKIPKVRKQRKLSLSNTNSTQTNATNNNSSIFMSKHINTEKLYEDYKLKENYLNALSIFYQIKEGEKYTFHPKTNRKNNTINSSFVKEETYKPIHKHNKSCSNFTNNSSTINFEEAPTKTLVSNNYSTLRQTNSFREGLFENRMPSRRVNNDLVEYKNLSRTCTNCNNYDHSNRRYSNNIVSNNINSYNVLESNHHKLEEDKQNYMINSIPTAKGFIYTSNSTCKNNNLINGKNKETEKSVGESFEKKAHNQTATTTTGNLKKKYSFGSEHNSFQSAKQHFEMIKSPTNFYMNSKEAFKAKLKRNPTNKNGGYPFNEFHTQKNYTNDNINMEYFKENNNLLYNSKMNNNTMVLNGEAKYQRNNILNLNSKTEKMDTQSSKRNLHQNTTFNTYTNNLIGKMVGYNTFKTNNINHSGTIRTSKNYCNSNNFRNLTKKYNVLSDVQEKDTKTKRSEINSNTSSNEFMQYNILSRGLMHAGNNTTRIPMANSDITFKLYTNSNSQNSQNAKADKSNGLNKPADLKQNVKKFTNIRNTQNNAINGIKSPSLTGNGSIKKKLVVNNTGTSSTRKLMQISNNNMPSTTNLSSKENTNFYNIINNSNVKLSNPTSSTNNNSFAKVQYKNTGNFTISSNFTSPKYVSVPASMGKITSPDLLVEKNEEYDGTEGVKERAVFDMESGKFSVIAAYPQDTHITLQSLTDEKIMNLASQLVKEEEDD